MNGKNTISYLQMIFENQISVLLKICIYGEVGNDMSLPSRANHSCEIQW